MKTRFPLAIALLLSLALPVHRAIGGDSPKLTLVRTIPLPDVRGRLDHMALDQDRQRLFVAASGNNSVEVVDLESGKRIHSINELREPQGVAFLAGPRILAVTSGGSGTCEFIDGTTYRRINAAHLGDDADNIQHDPEAHRIYVGFGTGSIAVIDEQSWAKVGDGRLNGHPEGFRLETAGRRMFVNVPRHRTIVVLERPDLVRVGSIPLDGTGRNYPMAIDEAHHRLLTCLRNPGRLAIVNTETLAQTGSIRIADDADDLSFDSSRGFLLASCGRGFIDIIRQDDADHYTLVAQIPTVRGARTSLYVQQSGLLYLAVPRTRGQHAEIRIYRISP